MPPKFGSRSSERSERSVSEILHYFSNTSSRVPPLPDEQNFEKQVRILFEHIAHRTYFGLSVSRKLTHLVHLFSKTGITSTPCHTQPRGSTSSSVARSHDPPEPVIQGGGSMIDEPEIHLHPAWVRQLYLALPQIGERNQFVLTTHSAELRTRAGADNALVDLGELGDAR